MIPRRTITPVRIQRPKRFHAELQLRKLQLLLLCAVSLRIQGTGEENVLLDEPRDNSREILWQNHLDVIL